jgi:hypothetical protein
MRYLNLATEPLTRVAFYIVVAATAALSSCGPPRYVPAAHPLSDPAAVLKGVRVREDEIRSLRARFEATAYHGADESEVAGVLLVRKTDHFRMRLMLPLGITVLDYVSRGDETWTFLPLSKEQNTEGATLFSPADVRETFQRGAAAFPGTCSATSDSPSIVDVRVTGVRCSGQCVWIDAAVRSPRRRATTTASRVWSFATMTIAKLPACPYRFRSS